MADAPRLEVAGANAGSDVVAESLSWRPAVRWSALIWVLTRAGFLLVAWIVTLLHKLGLSDSNPPIPHQAWPFHVFARWDAGHFYRIATQGYFIPTQGKPSYDEAFFPGYPLLSRWVADVFGLGHPGQVAAYAGLAIVTWLSALIAAVLLYRLTMSYAGAAAARWSVVILLVGPYSVFLMASYSEALFLCFAIGAWMAGRDGRWVLAGVLATGASAVRINGLFLALGLVAMYAVYAVDHRRSGRTFQPFKVLALGLPIAPVVAYFAYLHHHTGSWTTWESEERANWGRTTVAPWTALHHSLHALRHSAGTAREFQSGMELLFAAGLVVGVIALARRRSWPDAVFVGVTAVTLLTSDTYQSIPRISMTCFPLIVLVGGWSARQWQAGERRRLLIVATGFASVVIMTIDSLALLTNHWAG